MIPTITFIRLRAFADPPGQNGYFYLKQTKTLAENFSFYFNDRSLAFLPLVLARKAFGEELLAFQITIAATLGLLCLAIIYLVEKTKAPDSYKAIFNVLTIFCVFSSSFFAVFSLNFYKNLAAELLIVWSVVWLIAKRPRLAFLFFLFAFFTHKSVAFLGAAYLFVIALTKAYEFAAGARDKKKLALQFSGLIAVLSLFFALFLAFFPNSQAFLNFLGGTFSGPGPRLAWWTHLFTFNHRRALEVIAWLCILAILVARRKALPNFIPPLLYAVTLILIAAVHPFQKSGDASLGYRLVLLLPLLIYPLATLILFDPSRRWRLAMLAPLALVSAANFSPFGLSERAIAREIRPLMNLRADIEKIPNFVNSGDYLISHHGMEFFIDYITGIRCRSFLPEPEVTGKIFRLAFFPPQWAKGEPVRDEVEQVKLLQVGENYSLLYEEDWAALSKEHLLPPTWKNPNRRKPAHVYAE